MGANLDLKIRRGNAVVPVQNRHTATRITSGKQTWTLNSEDKVEITVQSPYPQTYEIGDEISVFGRDYRLNRLPKVKRTGGNEFEYSLEFEGVQYDLLRAAYNVNIDTTDNELQDVSGDSLTGNLDRFLEVLIANANRVFPGKWEAGTCPQTASDVTLTFSETDNCLSVLQTLCSESNFNCEFEIEKQGEVYLINLREKVGQILPYTFQFGRGRGLYQLTRENVSTSNIVTRLMVYGSTENITSKYRANRLCLPGKTKAQSYIEDAAVVAKYGIFEGRKNFDDIKPTYTGTVTAVTEGNVLTFKDANFPFDLNAVESDGVTTKYLISGVSAIIHFNTGNLAGYEFTVKSYNHTTKTFVINALTDDRGMVFPSATSTAFQYGKGDEYKISNIAYSDDITSAAEQDLQDEAETYYKQNSQPKVQYGLQVTAEWLQKIVGGTDTTIVNAFAVGDYLHVVDDELGVDKSVRIKSFTRELLDAYNYSLTLSDTVDASTTTRVLSELIDIEKVIAINNLRDAARARANWRTASEVLDMVFDPEGDYYSDKIKPNSVDTLMLSVGAKSMQFGLTGTIFEPNYLGKPSMFKWTGGVLTHYTIDSEAARSWELTDGLVQLTNTGAYYVYARVLRDGTSGEIYLTQEQKAVNAETNYYYFWIGVLNSVDADTNVRALSLTYGFTTVNGRFIKTGCIQSADGNTYFDLDNGEIGGKITFTRNEAKLTLEQLGAESLETKNYIDNTLPTVVTSINQQIDGKIETWFTNTDPSGNWTTTDERKKHIGDMWYNTDTYKLYTYAYVGASLCWNEVKDADAIEAYSVASAAQDTADGKRRVFTATPTTPYDIGDLWTDGTDLYVCKNAASEGSDFDKDDWKLATAYTTNANLETFISTIFEPTASDIYSQIDGKIETWYMDSDPRNSEDWTGDNSTHAGDLWFDTSANTLFRFVYISAGNCYWSQIHDQAAIDAADAASQAQDTADGKRRVFTDTPYTPYDKGDLWTKSDGELMVCAVTRTSGTYTESDWKAATKYTGDESLNTFIADIYNVDIADIRNQLDGVVETHFGDVVPTTDNEPAVDWTTTTDKEAHLGDIYYNNTSGIGYRWGKSGTTYSWYEIRDTGVTEALAAAAAAQDTADGKRRVFTTTPYAPYDVGDLWTDGTDLYVCYTAKASGGTYSRKDWGKATDYTNNEDLETFINDVFADTVNDITNQIDGKIDTWYTGTNPRDTSDWTGTDQSHNGDLWFDIANNHLYRFVWQNGGRFWWSEITDQTAVDAAAAAAAAQDTADGKRRVFTSQPYPPYDVGDLWTNGTDMYVCKTAKASGTYASTDWELATAYTGDENLNNFINNVYSPTKDDLYSLIDGKIETWYTQVDPCTLPTWTGDDDAHEGDLWFNIADNTLFRFAYQGSGVYDWAQITDQTAVDAAEAAAYAQDTADGKRRVFTSTPYTPYDEGDLWVQGSSGDIMVCATTRTSGTYTASDWVVASKYTDNSALETFITETYDVQINTFAEQIDGKVESWFQSTDPSNKWTTTAQKLAHVGDFWYNTQTYELHYYEQYDNRGATVYRWSSVVDADATAAYAAAAAAQDTADGKRRVFIDTPYPPYDEGDLWTDGADLRRCVTARTESEAYIANDWVVCVNYDNTQTVIDGGIVTSGTIQVAGDNASILAGITGNGTAAESIRFWAGASFENRATAPFRVQQDGTVTMTKANVTGTINATAGAIGGFNISGKILSSAETANAIILNGGTGAVMLAKGNFKVDSSGNVTMKNVTATGGTYSGVINMSGGMILPVATTTSKTYTLTNETTVLITKNTAWTGVGDVYDIITLPASPNVGQVLTIVNSNTYRELRVYGNGHNITPSCGNTAYGEKSWAAGLYLPIGVQRAKQLLYDGSAWWQINGFTEW